MADFAFRKGDKVLSAMEDWGYGKARGYDKIPGTVSKISRDGVHQVRWHDNHSSIHSDSELKKHYSS